MDVIYFLIPLALLLLITAIGTFLWAAKHGQFEDLDREAHRILFDEDMVKPSDKSKAESTANDTDKSE
ncbi:MAG: cbb3-type cytochrome oxidase assembly protein CcoS [Pseudomonadales bacterium]|nr:cbb3-type cytochrome oxidase assembly protein CcoS [Pseudomonadales bacterium]